MTEIEQLISNVSVLNKSYKVLAQSSGENFNIFSILNMETDENLTHSAFIAELLNKNGRHGYDNRFIKLFCEYFDINNSEFNIKNYKVVTEHPIGPISVNYDSGGRIDIFLQDDMGNTIMIENKVYAGEQNKQLIRYHNDYPAGKLFFLTLSGDSSTCKEAKKINNLYTVISYQNDIINWLDQCRREAIETPMLREVILQYIHLLRKLTNQNTNREMSKEIVNIVLGQEAKFESYKLLVNSKQEILKSFLSEDFIPFLEKLASKYSLQLDIDKEKFANLSQAWAGFSFSNGDLNELAIKITFAFNTKNSYTNLIFGFNPKTSSEGKNKEIQDKFNESFGKCQSTHWLAFRNYSDYENWNDLNVQQKLIFGDFKTDIEAKLKLLLQIISSVK